MRTRTHCLEEQHAQLRQQAGGHMYMQLAEMRGGESTQSLVHTYKTCQMSALSTAASMLTGIPSP